MHRSRETQNIPAWRRKNARPAHGTMNSVQQPVMASCAYAVRKRASATPPRQCLPRAPLAPSSYSCR
eukprot:1822543-Lingulodinium_polyedra.AAC.1